MLSEFPRTPVLKFTCFYKNIVFSSIEIFSICGTLKKKKTFFVMNLQNGSQLFFLNYYSSSEIWNYSYYVVIFVRKKFMVCVLDAMATAEKSFSRIDGHLKRTLTKKGISRVCHTK